MQLQLKLAFLEIILNAQEHELKESPACKDNSAFHCVESKIISTFLMVLAKVVSI